MSWQPAVSLLAFCLIIGLTGCGAKSTPSVHGKVLLDGESVTQGSINFFSQDAKGSKASAAIENGVYALAPESKLLPGKYRVEISWFKPTGKKVASADPGVVIDETREAVPAKYNTNSTLIAEIGSGDAEKDFALTSK
jgi:hypothetical protein